MLEHDDVYIDLLFVASKVAGISKLAFEPGDEVRVKMTGGFFDGEFVAYDPDQTTAQVLNPKTRRTGKFPVGNIQSLEEVESKKQVVEERDRKEHEEEEALLSAGKLDAAKAKMWEQVKLVPTSTIDAFAQFMIDNKGWLRIHWGELGHAFAEKLFADVGFAQPPHGPGAEGSRGGTTKMRSVSGKIFFPNTPQGQFAAQSLGYTPKDRGSQLEIDDTGLAFELARRGVNDIRG